MDYSLYLVTDTALSQGRSNRKIVEAALRGGVTMVQYRDKTASTRIMIVEAAELCEICRAAGVPFIVNDRIDVALAVNADGVHVGQDDMPASLVRHLIGKGKILGVSAGNLDHARQAFFDGADYIGAGPIFATPTKLDAMAPIGLEGLRSIVDAISIPVVAIGGINAGNAESILRSGAAGIAVVSAIVSAEDVERAASGLRAIFSGLRRPNP